MKKFFTSFLALFNVSMKMYFRNKGAVVFTLIVPIALLAVFGFISKSSGPSITVDVTNYSQSELSRNFVDALKNVSAFKVQEIAQAEAKDALAKGNIDLQVVIPQEFGQTEVTTKKLASATIQTYYNTAKPQNGQVGNLIINQIVSGINVKVSKTPEIIKAASTGVEANNLNFFDFILPGILGMIIMQSGIFGVAFAFVSFKASGSLRRLQATPVHPRNFVLAQAFSRLIMTLLTVAIIIGFGIKFFNFHMSGSYLDFSLVVILGSLIFIGIGFTIAGYAKDENQVAPLANLVQLPMLLLSGIFFSREAFPSWLHTITNYFPLTYLSDAMRHIANEGLHITQVGHDILGLAIWSVIIFVVAIKLFRWE